MHTDCVSVLAVYLYVCMYVCMYVSKIKTKTFDNDDLKMRQ